MHDADPSGLDLVVHRGGCHCGAVRFELDAPPVVDVLDCDCSICRMTGFLHLIVPATRFRWLSGRDALVEYRFNTGTARHWFCATCGIKSVYVPRSHPDGYSVNVHCLDPGTVREMRVLHFDDATRQVLDPARASGDPRAGAAAPDEG